MSVRILRRRKSVEDLEAIADHIAKDSPAAAVRFLENAESTLRQLAQSPGASTRFESNLPELANVRFRRVSGFPNHIVFFVEHRDAIEKLRILHGAQELESELETT
jgi:toxin ParE1/3/4